MTLKLYTKDGTLWIETSSLPRLRKELRLSPREIPNIPSLASWAKVRKCLLIAS